MKGIREIRGRIKSVKNTAQITRAMQLVAASKMKRAQNVALNGRPYSLLMAEILATLPSADLENFSHPLFNPRPVRTRGILVLSTDKGLCGPLNSNLFRRIADITDNAAYVAVGRKAAQFLGRTRRNLIADFQVSDRVSFKEVRAIGEFMIRAYEEGRVDTIEILYPRFINTLVQEPTLFEAAPVADMGRQIQELRERFGDTQPHAQDNREICFEPSVAEILGELPPLFVKQSIYQRILETKASEQSARMVAMKSATDNAKNLVESLTLEYNKARQAGITQEILELAASVAANK